MIGYEEEKVGTDNDVIELASVAVITEAGDNCAVARQTIRRATRIRLEHTGHIVTLDHEVLEGHRFEPDHLMDLMTLMTLMKPNDPNDPITL